jgi:signal transduction histidine kinase
MSLLRRLGIRKVTLRIQLALLYAGFFAACGVVLLVPVLTIRASLPDNVTPAILAQSNADVRAQVIRAGLILVALSALSLGAGWLIAGRFLRPLRTITATARNISATNLSRRVALGRRDDEFAELGATLDSLFARLEASFESQRRFVANASHELRTPLAAERTLLQVALADPDATAGTLRSACQQALVLGDQQERLIEALLTLASGERGVEQWQPFDLAELAGQVVEQHRSEAGRREVSLQTALAVAPATGDPSLIGSLVANLVDNAIRHNGPGGWAEVSTSMTSGRGRLRVANSGPVVPPGDMDRLFQPFQRLGRERTGSGRGHGLGLAIVRAIADAHGAVLVAAARPEGGLEVEVTFP